MWTYTTNQLPPENVLLDVTNSEGDVGQLIRKGRLFFLPDMSMYVYFVPKMWSIAQQKENLK